MSVDEVFQCIKDIENGKTIEEVAKEKNILVVKLKAYLLQFGGERGKRILLQELLKELPIPIEEIILKYKEGKNTLEIAKEMGVRYNWLLEKILQYESISGNIIHQKSKSYNRRTDLDADRIIEEYKKGISIMLIAEEFNASVTPIRRIINKYIKETGENIDEIHKEEVLKKRRQNLKEKSKTIKEQEQEKIELVVEIIKKYGYSYEQLCEMAKERGYEEIPKIIYYQALNIINSERKGEEK